MSPLRPLPVRPLPVRTFPAGALLGLALAALAALAAPARAQLSTPGTPPSLAHAALPSDVPLYVLPSPDVERLRAEDAERDNWPLRYGAEIPLALSSDDAGAWETLPSGELVWRLRIASPGARSLGVLFDRYELPASGRLYLYDAERTMLVGAFTRETRQPNGMLAVQPVLGDELWIEYAQDAADAGRPELRIGQAVHDYLGILDELRVGEPMAMMGGGCLIDANCPQALGFHEQKSSVIMVLMGGGLCSAGLVNNTAQDGTPYFLTASHCGNMTNVVAVFDYERTGCSSGGSSQSKTISGATLLANSPSFDSQLYRLSSAPPESYEPLYAGWDRSPQHDKLAVSISHPSGAPRKYARTNQAPKTQSARFQVFWDAGMIEGGSSGSPLFNSEGRVIGPACCVTNFACGQQTAWYGRFDKFYDTMNLGQWLDPLGTNPLEIEGHDPFRGQSFDYNGSGLNPDIYFSTTQPSLGATWNATVDVSYLQLPMTTSIVGYLGRRTGVFVPAGELLVNTATSKVFQSFAPSSGGPSRHSNPIPNMPSLANLRVYTQGIMILDGGQAYTNAQELVLR